WYFEQMILVQACQLQCMLEDRELSQTQSVNLQEIQLLSVVLVAHGGPSALVHGHIFLDWLMGDHNSGCVLAGVTRVTFHLRSHHYLWIFSQELPASFCVGEGVLCGLEGAAVAG